MSAKGAKQLLQFIYRACDAIEEVGGKPSDIKVPLRDLFKIEAHRYFMYLSASDGKVVPAERDYMNELFDESFTIQDYVRLINETDTYSVDFENEIPTSMKVFALFDSKMDEIGGAIGESFPNMIPLVLDFYQKAGIEFIGCDREITKQEAKDLALYIAKKKIILQQIVETENVEDVGIIGKKKGYQEETPKSNNSSRETGTIRSESIAASNESGSAEKALELVDYGWYIHDPSKEQGYLEFCGVIHNPNKDLVAHFPQVIVTVRGDDGSIIATDHQMGGFIMPGDTVTLVGMMSLSLGDIGDKSKITFDVDWKEYTRSTRLKVPARTTDFAISNVSERNGREHYITGEITNNYSEEVRSVNLSIVLKKDGKITYMENTFVSGLKPGKAKPFEFHRYSAWPEHDSIDVSAQVW